MNIINKNTWTIWNEITHSRSDHRGLFSRIVFCKFDYNKLKCIWRSWFFKVGQINTLKTHFENFHRRCRNSYIRNRISMRHFLTAVGNFSHYCGQGLEWLCTFKKVPLRCKVSQKHVVKTLLIIFLLVKTEWPNLTALKSFSKVHSKPFIEKNWYFLSGILLLRVAFWK